MSMDKFKELQKQLQESKEAVIEEVRVKKQEVDRLLIEIEEMCDTLGITFQFDMYSSIDDPDPWYNSSADC